MRINHNLPALNTYRQLTSNQSAAVKSTEKLSSGLRINRAGDDAAGLAISEKMRAQIRGLDQASRNASDAISMIQTAEGALNETHDILQRMRELAVQASTDTNTSSDRGEIQKEINQLTSEINRIGNTTEFNTQKLLNGDKSNTVRSSIKALVGADGKLTTSGLAIGSGTVNVASSATLATGDYTVAITSTTVTGSGAVTFTGANYAMASTGTATPSMADVTFTNISGSNPTFSGNAITINSGASGTIFSGANQSGNITLTRQDDGKIRVQITGFSGGVNSSGVSIDDYISADASGNFTYDEYGLSFKITDVAAFGSGDTISGNFASGDASIGTAQEIWTAVNVSGATKPAAFNFATTSAAMGDYTVNVITNADSSSGTIQLIYSGTNGSGLVLDTFSGVNFGADFNFDAHGVKFTMSGLSNFSGSETNTMKFSVNGTISGATNDVTTFTATLKDSAGATVSTATIGTDSGAGLNAAASLNLSGVTLAFSGGSTVTSGNTTIAIRGQGTTSTRATDASLSFQIGANASQSMSLEVSEMSSAALGITRSTTDGSIAGFTSGAVVNNGTNNTSTEYALDVSTSANATNAITVIQKAIDSVSSERSKLGAYQNRLEHTINNLGTSSENLTASESRIRDVDMAKEMMANTRNNILQQAAQAMLAQANQAPQQVLQLLR